MRQGSNTNTNSLQDRLKQYGQNFFHYIVQRDRFDDALDYNPLVYEIPCYFPLQVQLRP